MLMCACSPVRRSTHGRWTGTVPLGTGNFGDRESVGGSASCQAGLLIWFGDGLRFLDGDSGPATPEVRRLVVEKPLLSRQRPADFVLVHRSIPFRSFRLK
jgi:hypothetical protein